MDEAKIDSRQFQYDLAVANLNKPLMSGEREMNMNTYELMMEVARDMVVGLSAKKIASLIGKEIHPTVISDYEIGRRSPP